MSAVDTGLQFGAPIILVAGAAARVHVVRTHGGRMVFLSLVMVSVTLTVNIDAVYFALDAWTGVANLANLVEHVSGVLAGSLMLEAVSAALAPHRRLSIRVGFPAVVLGSMTAAFVVAWVPVESRDFTAASMNGGHGTAVVVYWILGLVYSGVAATQLGYMAWLHGPQATRRPTRAGMRIVVIGSAITVMWAILRSVEVLILRPSPLPGWFDLTSRILLAAAAPTIALGLLLNPIVTSCRTVLRLIYTLTLMAQLRPLWADLTRLCPHVLLSVGPRRRTLEDRLYRMVIEINDAALTLRTRHSDHPLGLLAAQLHKGAGAGADSDADLAAVTLITEARALAARRREWLHGRRIHLPLPEGF
jgi:hypothetical protein